MSAPTCSLNSRAPGGDMDLYEKEPAVTQALALVLVRQALEYLAAIKEEDASRHLQRAVDVLLKPRTVPPA